MHNKDSYRLPIGPQHPLYIEAENLDVYLDGETIVDVKVNLGYLHRGIEKALENRNFIRNIYLAERVCGICSAHHQLAYCKLIENILDIKIPERAKYIRTIIAELERLHSHFLWLGVMAYEMGLDTLFHFCWRDREHIMEILETISGNRVHYAMFTIGGVRRDVQYGPKILKILDIIEKQAHYYAKVFSSDKTILARTRNIGMLKKEDAEKFCAVGPIARASGISYDIRVVDPYVAYNMVDWNVITSKGCDVQARLEVRINEIIQSANIIRQCIKKLPRSKLRVNIPKKIPIDEAISRIEAPRGELIYYGRSNGSEKPERIKIRTPTYANVLSLKSMLINQQLADLPIVVASIDPCFSCADRVTLIDVKSEKKTVVDREYLRKLSEKK